MLVANDSGVHSVGLDDIIKMILEHLDLKLDAGARLIRREHSHLPKNT